MNERKTSKLLNIITTVLLSIPIFILALGNRTVYAAEVYNTNLVVNGNFIYGISDWSISGDSTNLNHGKTKDVYFHQDLIQRIRMDGWYIIFRQGQVLYHCHKLLI